MSTITFDTLKFANRLKASGVSDSQANAEAEALRDVLSEALDTSLATKLDVQQVAHRMDVFEAKMDKMQWMLAAVLAVAIANFAKQYF